MHLRDLERHRIGRGLTAVFVSARRRGGGDWRWSIRAIRSDGTRCGAEEASLEGAVLAMVGGG